MLWLPGLERREPASPLASRWSIDIMTAGLLALRCDDRRCVVIASPGNAVLAQVATLHRHGALRRGLCRCSTDMSPKHGFQAANLRVCRGMCVAVDTGHQE